MVSLLNGTVMFLADLIRHLSLPLRLDFIGVSSYGGRAPNPANSFTPKNCGSASRVATCCWWTISWIRQDAVRVRAKLAALQPRRIRICVLLDKPARRIEKVRSDYTGFEIPDVFVVGYGLDFAERYRNLPFVGVLHPQVTRLRRRSSGRERGSLRGAREPGTLCEVDGSLLLVPQRPRGLLECVTEDFPPAPRWRNWSGAWGRGSRRLGALRGSALVAVGVDYREPAYVLQPGDEVAMFPAVQGG